MLRLSVRPGDLLQDADVFNVHVAGSEANVAYAAARVGLSAAWVSALPSNPLGTRIATTLTAGGVDTSLVRWVDGGRLGLYFVELGTPPRPDERHLRPGGVRDGDGGTRALRLDDRGGHRLPAHIRNHARAVRFVPRHRPAGDGGGSQPRSRGHLRRQLSPAPVGSGRSGVGRSRYRSARRRLDLHGRGRTRPFRG